MLGIFVAALLAELCLLALQWSQLAYTLAGGDGAATLAAFGKPYELSLLPVLQTVLYLQLAVLAIFLVPAGARAVQAFLPSAARRRKKSADHNPESDESMLYLSLYLFSVFIKGFMGGVAVWFLGDLVQMTQGLATAVSYQSDAGVVLVLTNCLQSLQQAWLYGVIWLAVLAAETCGSCFFLGRATAGHAKKS